MYERFTDRARRVMQLANQEAQCFNHEYVGAEHILLGLIREGSGVAANVLKNLDIDPRRIRLQVEMILQVGPDTVTTGKLPHTPRAKKVIEYAVEEARNLNHNYVATEHLLLGLLREQEDLAAQILMNLGLGLEDARKEVLNLMSGPSTNAWVDDEPRQHPDAEVLQHCPAPVVQAVEELNAQIEQLNQQKEQAIAEQEFYRAAELRDQADKLIPKRTTLLRLWRRRVQMLLMIQYGGTSPGAALAAAVLAGDWAALPVLADALEETDDERCVQVRNWVEDQNTWGVV